MAEEIAKLHDVSLIELQRFLLRKWLAVDSVDVTDDMEQTFIEDVNTTVSETQNAIIEMSDDAVNR